MKPKKLCLALLVAVILVRPALCKEVQCTDRAECWPDGSAMHSALTAADAQRKDDVRLARAHKDLLDLLAKTTMDGKPWMDDRLRRALETQQAGLAEISG